MTRRLPFVTLLLLLLPPLFWAGNAVVGRASVGHIGPLALSFWRWTFAFMLLLPFAGRDIWRARVDIRTHWRIIVLIGVLGIGGYNSFQYLALQTSPALNVTLIAAAMPIASLVTGLLLFRAKISRSQVIGALFSLAGVLCVIGRGSLTHLIEFRFVAGDAWMLVAITVWSCYTWLLHTRRPPIPTAPLLALQMVVGALAILPFALAETLWHPVPVQLDWQVVATLAYVSLFASLVAYFCWDRGVARAGATLPVYFANLTPLFTAIFATIWLDETIESFHLLGALLIFLGIYLGNRR